GFRIRPPIGRGMEVIVEITDRRSALVHYGRRWPEQRRFGGTLERFQQRTGRRQLPLGGETLSIKHQRAGGELKHVRIELFQRGEDGILTRDTPLEKRLLVPGLELATAREQACHPACKLVLACFRRVPWKLRVPRLVLPMLMLPGHAQPPQQLHLRPAPVGDRKSVV